MRLPPIHVGFLVILGTCLVIFAVNHTAVIVSSELAGEPGGKGDARDGDADEDERVGGLKRVLPKSNRRKAVRDSDAHKKHFGAKKGKAGKKGKAKGKKGKDGDAQVPASVLFDVASIADNNTYDGVIARTLDRKHWGAGIPSKYVSLAEDTGCDIFHVPFNVSLDDRCLAYLANMSNWAEIVPVRQRFEQRTIKFKILFKDDRLRAMMKVPQVLFPLEPYSEIAAFAIDRLLDINRVPPITLVDVPVDTLVAAALAGANMTMVPEFLQASNVHNYTEWVDKDFVQFVKKTSRGGGSFGTKVGDAWRVNVSLQVFIAEVNPLLQSSLAVPYSKSNPGWHKWFDPNQFPAENYTNFYGSLLALSELAMYDFVILNNDRSPNKNNFVVGGCHSKSCQRSGMVNREGPPTYVHLDQGMAMYGFLHYHNPMAKKNVTFCRFYRPLVLRLQRLYSSEEDGVVDRFVAAVPKEARRFLGRNKVVESAKQVGKLLTRVKKCLTQFNESVVLLP
jgi:hypothetical protein